MVARDEFQQVADERIEKARGVGFSDHGDDPIEGARLDTLRRMLESADSDRESRALTHIERMAKVRQEMRSDTLKHGETGMGVYIAHREVRAEQEDVGGGSSPESVTAIMDRVTKERAELQNGGSATDG